MSITQCRGLLDWTCQRPPWSMATVGGANPQCRENGIRFPIAPVHRKNECRIWFRTFSATPLSVFSLEPLMAVKVNVSRSLPRCPTNRAQLWTTRLLIAGQGPVRPVRRYAGHSVIGQMLAHPQGWMPARVSLTLMAGSQNFWSTQGDVPSGVN